jgi:hypothetical protein
MNPMRAEGAISRRVRFPGMTASGDWVHVVTEIVRLDFTRFLWSQVITLRPIVARGQT